MPIPTLTGEAIVVGDEGATLRHTQAGQAVANARLKFSDRRRDDQGNWSDSSVLWIDATAWGPLAERLAEVGEGGTVLKVSGRIDTQEWEDKQTGQKRSKPRLTLDMLEPKPRRDGGQPQQSQSGFGGGGQQNPAQQPWGGAQATPGPWDSQPAQQGGWDSPGQGEIPF